MLKKEIEKGQTSIKNLRGEISGANWVEANITSVVDDAITWDTPIENLKVRLQILTSGAGFSQGHYRIDNHTGKEIHQHFKESEDSLKIKTLSGAVTMVLGSEVEDIIAE